MKYAPYYMINTEPSSGGPSNKDVNERAKFVLGTLIIEPEKYFEISEMVRPYMFPTPALVALAEIIWQRSYDMAAIDTGILKDEYPHPELIDELAVSYWSGDIVEHAQIVREHYTRQSVNGMLLNAISGLNKTWSPDQVMHEFLSSYDLLQSELEYERNRSKVITEAIDGIRVVNGVPTGFEDLDALTLGLLPGSLNVIGARPGMGKTLITMQIILSAIKSGAPVLFFSVEMSEQEIIQVLACLLAGVSFARARREEISQADREKIIKAGEQIYEMPLQVVDPRTFDGYVETAISKAYAKNARGECGFVVIDYLQLLSIHGKYDRLDIAQFEVCKKAKFAAEKMGIPFLILSQCSREPEKQRRIPHVGDLLNGGIEPVADRIFTLWRPEVYKIKEDKDGNSTKHKTEISICKDRQFGENVGTELEYWFLNGGLVTRSKYEEAAYGEEPPSQFPAAMPKADYDEDLPF